MVEFNNGFVTALALFYGHSMDKQLSKEGDASLVLYCATDHLYDIEYPDNISEEFKEGIKSFVDYAFTYRMKRNTTREEAWSIFEHCRKILERIDKEIFGLEVEVVHS